MAAEFWTDAARMVTAGAIVAAVAVPIGLVGWHVARRRGEPLLLPWKPWRVPWTGFAVFFAFVVLHVGIPGLVAQAGVRPLAVGVVALPIQLTLLVVGWRLLYPRWKPGPGGGFAGRVALVGIGWAVLTPVVLVVHATVLLVFATLDWQPGEHPLARLGDLSALDRVLFVLLACVAAPLIEEILSRGLLLPWVIGARERNAGGPESPRLVPAVIRPWLVLAFAVLPVVERGTLGPAIFLGVLAAGLGVIWVTVRRGRRHVRGVYVSAAFFALMHSNIWPTPIPLFVLGLGLGWLAVRTRGVLVPVAVHALFNAVATIQVLSGGAG